MGFFEKLKEGLSKTKNAFVSQVDNLFKSFVKVDEELFDELEELLICADVGVGATEFASVFNAVGSRFVSRIPSDPYAVKTAFHNQTALAADSKSEAHRQLEAFVLQTFAALLRASGRRRLLPEGGVLVDSSVRARSAWRARSSSGSTRSAPRG